MVRGYTKHLDNQEELPMYDKLAAVISESGMWDGNRKHTHAFLLSPSVYKISEAQRDELSRLGFALHDCLAGLSHIAVIAHDARLNYAGTWRFVRRVFSAGVPKIYSGFHGMNVLDIPRLLKVDLMVDESGDFRIAEIDGHNKHGVGYSTLGLRFRKALYPDAKSLPGTVEALSREVMRLGHRKLNLFYADQERFYIPEFEVARQEFMKYGIDCSVVSEIDVDEALLKQGLFLDLPFLYKRSELYDVAAYAYRAGDIAFIIPPKPFFGAKGVLALLRNDARDNGLEAMLRTFVKERSLELVRSYIPETLLVGKLAEGFEAVKERVSRKRYVLKESISSGMKGTVFSDEPNFEAILGRACRENIGWILQEEVANQPQTFSWFEEENGTGPQLKEQNDWFMRVTAQYVNRELADAIVTARRSKSVHGAKDCLQLGAVIT